MTEYIVVLNNLNNWDLKEFIDENNTYSIYSSADKEMVIDYARSLASSMKPSRLIIKDENNSTEKEELFLNNKCRKCGKQLPEDSEQDLCKLCIDIVKTQTIEIDNIENSKKELENLKRNPALVIASTTPFLEGYSIEKYISVEYSKVTASFKLRKSTDIDISKNESNLELAQKQSLYNLKEKAVSCGGNAVIGISTNYIESYGSFFIMTSGTVVKVKQNDK